MVAEPATSWLDILGIQVSAANIESAVDNLDQMVRQRSRGYVTLTGVHGIMESVRDPHICDAHNQAALVLPDGMPLVWLLWRRGFGNAGRVYGPDLMLAMFARSQQAHHRHFLYGAVPGTLDKLKARLERRFPHANIVGAYAPPFRSVGALEDEAVLRAINATEPDIVWVGLGTPKQEVWMARHRDRLSAPVLIGVGAAFDFHAGQARQAPRFLQTAGLEWAFRAAMEPRRLGKRYLRNNPAFLFLLAAEKLGLRKARHNPDAGAAPHAEFESVEKRGQMAPICRVGSPSRNTGTCHALTLDSRDEAYRSTTAPLGLRRTTAGRPSLDLDPC